MRAGRFELPKLPGLNGQGVPISNEATLALSGAARRNQTSDIFRTKEAVCHWPMAAKKFHVKHCRGDFHLRASLLARACCLGARGSRR